MATIQTNMNATRDDYYVRPSFRAREGYQKDLKAALLNLATRLTQSAMLGFMLFCLGAFVWYVTTQTIPTVTDLVNQIPPLFRHAIRDGDFEKFSAAVGVAIVFAKPAKDVKLKERPGLIYRIMGLLGVPTKYQERPTSGRQLALGYFSIYLASLFGLAVGTCLIGFWPQAWTWLDHFSAVHTFSTHSLTIIHSNVALNKLWSVLLTDVLKFIPSVLGLLFFGRIPLSRLTRDANLVVVKALVERNIKLRWPMPSNIRDLAGDLQFQRDHDGTIVDAPDEVIPALLGVFVLAAFCSGFGACIVEVVAHLAGK
jgi:hypothetical protein